MSISSPPMIRSSSLTSQPSYTNNNPSETIHAIAQKRIKTLSYIQSFYHPHHRTTKNWLNTHRITPADLHEATSQIPPSRTLGYFVLGMACGSLLELQAQQAQQGQQGPGAKEMARAWMGVVREWEVITSSASAGDEETQLGAGAEDTKAKMKSLFFRKGSTASLTSPTTTTTTTTTSSSTIVTAEVVEPAFGADHSVVILALLDILVEMYTAFISLLLSDLGTRAEQTFLLDMFVKIDGKIKRGVVGREVKELEGIARRGLGREIRGALAGLGGMS
ncbi:hypothetical protein YB2330_006564 [Saitoella coloradoensis]